MLKSFKIEILNEQGEWDTLYETHKNHQRMIKGKINAETTAVRFVPLGTYYRNLFGMITAARKLIFLPLK